MNPHSLINRLAASFENPLPGWQAQWELASLPGRPRQPPANHRKGGVLSLLYPHEDQLHMVFMKRTDDGKAHGGQISFPGGKQEPEDPSLRATALREAEEELGILPDEVTVLGELTQLYIPVSNFLVKPVVGYAAERPNFRPSPVEVQEILEVPLKTLVNQRPRATTVRVAQGMQFEARAFLSKNQVIWGATAMMLNELLTMIRPFHP